MKSIRAALTAAVLIAATLVVFGSPAEGTTTPAWSIQTTPNAGYFPNELNAVSCTSATACTAVGSYQDYGDYKTMIESWNGTSWSIVPSPNPAALGGISLAGVSCTSTTACTAVGWYPNAGGFSQTLIESWDGATWSIVPSPNSSSSQNNQLNAVSCTSAMACTAVGWHQGASAGQQTLIETWDGTTWSIVPSPNSASTQNNALNAVSCTSATACTAVGEHTSEGSTAGVTLIETWDGTSWTIVPSPSTSINGNSTLTGVSCTSLTACTAVGRYTNEVGYFQTLIERWDGATWSIVSSANSASTHNQLNAVSCTSATACAAVGYYYEDASGLDQTLIESWNGTSWSIVPSPNPANGGETNPAGRGSTLAGVSCTSSTACTAVGTNEALFHQTLIETWDGTSWSIAKSANNFGDNALEGVSCISATACTAVGRYRDTSGAFQTLIESWDGTSWSVVPNSQSGSGWYRLEAVSCTSSTACTAVGEHTSEGSSAGATLIETWDGTGWSVVPSLNTSSALDFLRGVSCTSATACTAVGGAWNAYDSPHWPQTLIETWDGISWSIVPSPNTSPNATNYLNGVSCISPTACTAVGVGVVFDHYQPLIETWNGTSWSIVPSPSPSNYEAGLDGVSCISATACTAVGYYRYYQEGGAAYQTLIETWDGTSWSIVPSPNSSSTQDNELNAVSCTSPTACTAVGQYDSGSGVWQTLIETWDGTAWSIVPSPNTSPTQSQQLNAVSCTSATACTAVGSDSRTLAVAAVSVATAPGAPTALTATPGDRQVTLTWSAPVSDGGSPITGYDVYVGTTPGGESSTPDNASPLAAGATSYTVPSLTDGTTYYFMVKAINAVGHSAASTEASATPSADQTINVTTPAPATAAYGSSFGVAATASSGLPVTITSAGVCTGGGITGSATITMTAGTGTCTVTYSQTGNAAYHPAPTLTSATTATLTTTGLLYTGSQLVYLGSTLTPAARLSSAIAGCAGPGRTVSFAITDDNPATAAPGDGPYSLGSATTNAGGQATATGLTTTGWQSGVYTVQASFAGTPYCAASADQATLTVADPGDAATGGGWYTLSGSGRVNFAFTVHRLQGSDPPAYKGQVLLINNGKWRLKGTLDSYAEHRTSGAASGTADLYRWDQSLNGGLGDWALSESGVAFTISFTDSGEGAKASPDTFGIQIDHVLTASDPPSLPNSLPQPIKGGNVRIGAVD